MSTGEKILNLFFPRKCAFCASLLEEDGEYLCPRCRTELSPFPAGRRARAFKGVDFCFSPLPYEGAVRKSLLDYKFSGRRSSCSAYADLIIKYIGAENLECDYISWVPLSKRRLRSRGYDQARLLAHELSRRLGKTEVRLLIKKKNVRAQSSLKGIEERSANIRGAYVINKKYIDRLRGKTIVLVDDIVTTGATLGECAGVLRQYGPALIGAVTVAGSKN